MINLLHNLASDLDTWKKDELEKKGKIQLPNVFEGLAGVDTETSYAAVFHLLHTIEDFDGVGTSFQIEFEKLLWLFEALQNTPDAIKYSKHKYSEFDFSKITGDR